MAFRFTRRSLLIGLGGVTLSMALGPEARRSEAQIGTRVPVKRLMIFMQNNGTQRGAFWPTAGTFHSPILEPLLGQPNLAAKTTLIKGVYLPRELSGTDGNEHDIGFARMFTGAPLLNIAGHPWGGATSVDQLLARAWNVETLTLAVLASVTEPHPKPGFDHRRSFSYVGPAQLRNPSVDPFVVYGQLFPSSSGPPTTAAQERLVLRRSVLDAVASELGDVQRRLGSRERAKLDLHLTAIRETEQRISNSLAGRMCDRTIPVPRDFGRIAPDLLVTRDDAIPELASDMIDLASTALICGQNRIASLQLGYGGGKWRFGWAGIDVDFHGEVAHRDTTDSGSGDPVARDRAISANHWYCTQVARFCATLDAVPEGDGTMLDHTLVVWANEQARGDHRLDDVPIVLIGGGGIGAPAGGRVIDRGPQPFQRLGCTLLNVLGTTPVAGFGDLPSCGSFDGYV